MQLMFKSDVIETEPVASNQDQIQTAAGGCYWKFRDGETQ